MTSKSWEELQELVVSWASSAFPTRSFTTIQRKLCLSEIPELMIAIGEGDVEAIKGELADNLILILDMAHLLQIDLPSEIEKKMEINRARTWQINQFGVSQHVDKID